MLDATTLTVGYDETEDRLLMTCRAAGGEAVTLLLTRRITRRLLAGFAGVLARSSPTLGRTPAELRAEVIVLEHLGALAGAGAVLPEAGPPGPEAGPAADGGRPAIKLVTKVDLQTLPDRFLLVFHDAESALVRLAARRPEFHRLLSLLDRHAAAAEWSIRGDAGWLGQTEAVMRAATAGVAS